jgi:putative ABC transport system permease protein
MLLNYFKIALRNLYRNTGYTLLNGIGLGVGLAVAALIILYIQYEKSHDRWLEGQAEVYRVYRQWGTEAGGSAWTPSPLASALRMQFPQVRQATQVNNQGEALVGVPAAGKALYVKSSAATDSSFLTVLPLPLRYGDARTALQKPYSALLSAELAAKLFGEADPVGKVLRYNDKTDYQITGVLAALPAPFHLEAELYLTDPSVYSQSWQGNGPATYVRLRPETHLARLEAQMTGGINAYLHKERPGQEAGTNDLPNWRLQPLRDIHLYSTRIGGPFPGRGDARSLYILGGVATLILVIASINYTNLATAQAVGRAKEVGIRKVNGAARPQLIGQFLAEAVLQSLVALPLAAGLAMLFLPAFNRMVDRNLLLGPDQWQQMGGYWMALVLGLGLLSGSYPAFFLSAYQPAAVLKGNLRQNSRGGGIRQGLVVTQFSIAIAVAIVMVFIYQQVHFMLSQRLGFQPEQVVVIPINTGEAGERIEALASRLRQHPRIQEVTYATSLPGTWKPDNVFQIAGVNDAQSSNLYFTSPDYARTLGLALSRGRFFSYQHPADTAHAFVVNEAFVQQFGLRQPVGHQMKFSDDPQYGTIIGVVKDFHYQGLQRNIRPLVMSAGFKRQGWQPRYAAIRVSSQDLPATLAFLKAQWRQIEPAHPMRYSFLDDTFARQYDTYSRLGETMLYATLLTILIACLGLFGLASFVAGQRTREIGIRRVLGATEWEIMHLLGRKFVQLVGIASVLAMPLAFWVASEWLAGFAYRIRITAVPFLLASGLALLVAAFTVGFRAYRAALANPVKSLRSE